MNPLINILAGFLVRRVASDAIEAAIPRKRGKATDKTPVEPKKKNWKPLALALATGVCIGTGLYTGTIDSQTAFSMLSGIDFNSILALFGN